MNTQDLNIIPESPDQYDAVEALTAEAFGPGRFTRTAFRLREGVASVPELSFCCYEGDQLIGCVKQTKVRLGEDQVILLGPLVVAPEFKSKGIGAALMEEAVSAAGKHNHSCIILVGDLPYYERFGFVQIKHNQIKFPGPVDPARVLICALQDNEARTFEGTLERWSEGF